MRRPAWLSVRWWSSRSILTVSFCAFAAVLCILLGSNRYMADCVQQEAQAKDELLAAAFALPEKVLLRQKSMELQIVGKEYLLATDYEALAEKYFAHPLAGKYLHMHFLTSCAFKSEGQYVIFPQPQFILGSLVKRWNAFADSNKLEAPGVAQDLAQEVYVADYRLRMQAFSVDGARIPAFRGDYTLGMKNNLMSNRIIAMLGEYANYCGVGIKTALGMGAVRTELQEKW